MKTVGMYGGKFIIPHNGHVFAMIKASTMVDELHVIVSYDDKYEAKVLYKDSNFVPITYQQRLRWWHQITKDMPHVHVHAIEERQTGHFSDWEKGAEEIKKVIGTPITHIFSSEHKYEAYFEKLYPIAKHVLIDPERERHPISGTKLRRDGVLAHWQHIPEVVKPYFVKKVVVIGSESVGKSTLVKNLANVYGTNYVEEFGRTYYERLGNCADITLPTDYAEIAFEHKYHEKKQAEKANKVLFIDTEANVTSYYAQLYLGHNDPTVEAVADMQYYDLWLFLEPDVKWVDDGTRTFGEQGERDDNSAFLKRILDERGINYWTIGGNYQQRLEEAIHAVDTLLKLG